MTGITYSPEKYAFTDPVTPASLAGRRNLEKAFLRGFMGAIWSAFLSEVAWVRYRHRGMQAAYVAGWALGFAQRRAAIAAAKTVDNAGAAG